MDINIQNPANNPSILDINITQLSIEIKQLILSECEKEDDFEVEDIDNKEPLFGRKSRLALDSLDALQLSLALKKKFGVNIEGSKESRKYLQSVHSICQLITDRNG